MSRAITRRAPRPLAAALLLLALAGCKSAPATPPTLADLKTAAAAGADEAAGERLIALPPGLNGLTPPARDATAAPPPPPASAPAAPPPTPASAPAAPTEASPAATLAAVHGFASEGAEWVAPLARLDAPDTRFYRWDWLTCPAPAADALVAALTALAAEPGVDRIRVIAHSYGGLVAALAARRYPGPDPLEVHIVAAPLAGSERLTALCGPLDPGPAATGPVTVRQWRTVHAQDGAFRDLPVDPQVVDWAGADVVALPADWDGGRLGHNRSLRWVAEQLAAP